MCDIEKDTQGLKSSRKGEKCVREKETVNKKFLCGIKKTLSTSFKVFVEMVMMMMVGSES